MRVLGCTSTFAFLSCLAPFANGVRVQVDQIRQIMNAPNGTEGWRVFSDVDDTLACSKNDGIAGIDTNCDYHKELYPGNLQFFLELSRGPTDDVENPPKVVPLSARPEELKFLHLKESGKFYVKSILPFLKKAGVANWGLDLEGAQYGSLLTSISVLKGAYESGLSQKKFAGWLSYNAKEPSFFVGDNGQGDLFAAEMMMDRQDGLLFDSFDIDQDRRLDEVELIALGQACGVRLTSELIKLSFPKGNKEEIIQWLNTGVQVSKRRNLIRSVAQPSLTAAFIHHVQHRALGSMMLESAPQSKRSAWKSELRLRNIFLFMQYGHAACIAYSEGFISADGYHRVMLDIKDECPSISTPRLACRLVLPEFDFSAGGEPLIRPASECMMPRQFRKKVDGGYKEIPQLLAGLTSDDFFAQFGNWAVSEKCKEIDAGTLTRIKGALEKIRTLDAASNSSLTWNSECWGCPVSGGVGAETPVISPAVAAGVPYMIYWILRRVGLTCLSSQGKSCASQGLATTGFHLTEVGKLGRRHVCRLSLE